MATTLPPYRHDTPLSFHTPPSAHPTTSASDTLPSIDFDFPSLRAQMSAFTAKFDAFITAGRARVLSDRNAFRLSLAEVSETRVRTRRQLTSLSEAAGALAETLAREEEEKAELLAGVEALRREREEARARKEALVATVEALQAGIRARREEVGKVRRAVEAQARKNGPEIRCWEEVLGLRIEGAGLGRGEEVRFWFGCVDERDPDREMGFTVDTSGRDVVIGDYGNALDEADVAEVEARFNEGGELAGLLRDMRGLFVKACR